MLTYFRVNDPYRMLAVFILLVLIRLPFLLTGDHLTLPELNWMLVGENMAEGDRLYLQVWDNIGPLSALVYHLVGMMFPRSQTAYILLATLLTTYQSFIFNDFLLSKKAFHDNTYIPALLYGLLSCFSFDFYTLSPVLLSLTWILLALRNIFYRIESQSRDPRILSTGIFVGLAALCYLPSLIYIVSTLLAYLLFANVSARRFFLLLYGLALPFLVAFTYFYLFDASSGFMQQYVLAFRNLSHEPYVGLGALLMIGAIPLIFLVVSLYRLGQYRRYTNQQSKLQQIMVMKLIAALITLFFVQQLAPYHLLLFVPPIAFFITHFLLIIRRILIAELVITGLAVLLVMNGYALLFNYFSFGEITHIGNLMVQPTNYDAIVKDKRVLVLGNDLSVYRQAQLATPYLNWQLAAQQLANLDYFGNISAIYAAFGDDMPDLIIDEVQLMPQIFDRIPALEKEYRQLPGQPVYQRTERVNR
ncbi:MAG: hypothetical protein RIG62_14375 [Cyclobacteriaceae bacterium]